MVTVVPLRDSPGRVVSHDRTRTRIVMVCLPSEYHTIRVPCSSCYDRAARYKPECFRNPRGRGLPTQKSREYLIMLLIHEVSRYHIVPALPYI